MIPQLDTIPPLAWTHGEGTATGGGATLTLVSAPDSDWIRDARVTDAPPRLDATALVFPASGDATLAACVEVVGPRTTFDAGVLVVWIDDLHWAKLCFEMSPAGRTMVVSVVTDVHSDDANAAPVNADRVHLRVVRVGAAFAFQWSPDGAQWRFVRLFRLPTASAEAVVRLGFLAQAPDGGPCTARFTGITLSPGAPATLREGEAAA